MTLWALVVALAVAVGAIVPIPRRGVPDLVLKGLPFFFLSGGLAAAIWFLPVGWGPYLLWGQQASVLVLLWANRAALPMRLVGLGFLTNVLAIAANHGRMPVLLQAVYIINRPQVAAELLAGALPKHSLFTGHPLNWLGDWIPLVRWVVSPGDVLIAVGIFWLVCRLVLRARAERLARRAAPAPGV
ncbi:MAG TPA: DUF5317 family protein [Symbiobacteriaceae bacterium]|nr:DUF5317 family protein [Symbiobacteriaceae bacterium]